MKRWLSFLVALLLPLSAQGEQLAKVYFKAEAGTQKIAITIDDCKSPEVIEKMLDLFAREGVHVTFYVLGFYLREKDQALWRRVLEEGHEIGNHTHKHASLQKKDRSQVAWQLRRCDEALNKVLGFDYTMKTMRPPFGNYRFPSTLKYIKLAGYKSVIMWSVSQTDAKKAYKQIEGGDVCLFHTIPKDLRCLEELIPKLKADGFEMVTISELLGLADDPQPDASAAPPAETLAVAAP